MKELAQVLGYIVKTNTSPLDIAFSILPPPHPLIWTPRLSNFQDHSYPPYYLDPSFIKHCRVQLIRAARAMEITVKVNQ